MVGRVASHRYDGWLTIRQRPAPCAREGTPMKCLTSLCAQAVGALAVGALAAGATLFAPAAMAQ